MADEQVLRILIVEDDQVFRETVLEILRDEGYKVKGARSLSKAAKRLKKHPFDLVLTDMEIGEASGVDVIQVATQKRPGAKIVMMSAGADGELVTQGFNSGAAKFIAKPFRVSELLETVRGLLSISPPNNAEQAQQDAASGPGEQP
jgi:DNA-binding response OmpR family regulator